MENLSLIPTLAEILERVEKSLTELEKDVRAEIVNNAGYKRDVSWLNKFFWVFVTVSGSALAFSILGIILRN